MGNRRQKKKVSDAASQYSNEDSLHENQHLDTPDNSERFSLAGRNHGSSSHLQFGPFLPEEENWQYYRQRFEVELRIHRVLDDNERRDILLSKVGPQAFRVVVDHFRPQPASILGKHHVRLVKELHLLVDSVKRARQYVGESQAFVKKTIMACEKLLQAPIKGVLLDISGVLKDGCQPIQGSVHAVKSLQASKIPFLLVTNETSRPINKILGTLNMLGYEVTEKDLITPVPAVIKILKKENLRPFLMIHPEVIPDFGDVDTSNPNCVVMGDAAEFFQYNFLNECFRKLMGMENPILFSLGQGKYFRDEDGLALDVGPFCKAIEYATGVKATVVGKPSPQYFLDAVSELKLQPNEVVMIGDDIVSDVGGAQKCGLRGVLVRTGKYMRDRDEPHESVMPDGIVDNLQEAVNIILKHNS